MTSPPSSVPVEQLLRHRAWVRGLARRLVGDDRLDDVEQQTWLAALRSPPREGGSVRGWLATVVRNAARKQQRSATRRGHYESQAPSKTAAPGTDTVVTEAETQQNVVQAVLELAEPYRTTILLRYFEDLPPRAVAQRMGVGAETVRTRTKRGVVQLREKLATRYGSRARWRLALIPVAALTGPPPLAETAASGSLASAATSSFLGVLVMTTSQKLIAILAVVLLCAAGILVADQWVPANSQGDTTEGAAAPEADAPTTRGDRRRSPRRDAEADGTAAVADEASSSETDAETPAPQLALRVLRQDGGRVLSGIAYIIASDGDFTSGVLDADGRLSLTTFLSDGLRLALALPGRAVEIRPIPNGARELKVEIAAAQTVAGRVVLDGGAPLTPIALSLNAVREAWLPREELPQGVWEQLTQHGFSSHAFPVHTSPDGTFRFSVLRKGSLARIGIVDRHIVGAYGDRSFAVTVPDERVEIELVSLPGASGRIVEVDGTPIEGAVARFSFTTSRGGGVRTALTDKDGHFRVTLPRSDVSDVRFTIQRTNGLSRRKIEVVDVTTGMRALGDLALPADRQIHLEVRDEDDRPIASAAVVCPTGETSAFGPIERPCAEPTSRDGMTLLRIDTATPSIRIGARGYVTTEFALPQGQVSYLVLKLAAAPVLQVNVRSVAPEQQLDVELTSRSRFLQGDAERLGPVWGPLPGAAPHLSGDTEDGGRRAAWRLPKSGQLTLGGLRAGASVQVTLFDALGVPVISRSVALGTRGTVELELKLPSSTLRTTARLVDATVKGVAGADVFLFHPGTTQRRRRIVTDENGLFDSGPLFGGAPSVIVEHGEFAPTLLPALPASTPGEPAVIRMERGRDVKVRIFTQSGRGQTGRHVTIHRTKERSVPYTWDAHETDTAGIYIAENVLREDVIVEIRTEQSDGSEGSESVSRHDCAASQDGVSVTIVR